MQKLNLSFFLAILVFLGCTDNPFFGDDDNTIDRHLVRGRVVLADGKSSEGIYVWLDSLNLATRTGSNGDFSLSIPKTDSLKGYNSAMHLYYYVGNYKIAYSPVLVRDGLFEYGKYEIDNNGYINHTITLDPLITINTEIAPASVLATEESRALVINVTIRTIDSTVMVFTEMDRNLVLGSYIFKPEDTTIEQATRYSNPGVSLKGFYVDSVMSWQGIIVWKPGLFAVGSYDLYPYILIQQPDLPDALLESIGPEAKKFSQDYLKIPFRQDPARFTIY